VCTQIRERAEPAGVKAVEARPQQRGENFSLPASPAIIAKHVSSDPRLETPGEHRP
jgi:hypothetical protein